MSYLRLIVAWNKRGDGREYLPKESVTSAMARHLKTYRTSLQIDYSVKLGNTGTKKADGRAITLFRTYKRVHSVLD